MIKLVEHLSKLVAIISDARGRVVLAGLLYGCAEFVHLLDELDFLARKTRYSRDSRKTRSFAEDGADTGVGVLNEGAGIAIEVDTLLRVEEHVLAGIDLEDEVFQRAHAHDAGDLVALFFAHIIELAQFHRGLQSIIDHQLHQIVGINDRSFAALHLTIRQLHHTV